MMRKKFQVNRTKIKGGCQSETKPAQQHSCIDLTLEIRDGLKFIIFQNNISFNEWVEYQFSILKLLLVSLTRMYNLFRKSHV